MDIDIIFLQELWLTPETYLKIETISENHICYGKSAMDLAVRSSVLKGRHFGGVCILLKSNIANLVKFSKTSERYSIVIIENYLFISVYFPTISSDFDLCTVQSMIADIEEVFISVYGHLIGTTLSGRTLIGTLSSGSHLIGCRFIGSHLSGRIIHRQQFNRPAT